MRLIGLLVAGAGAAYAYKRFMAGRSPGAAETEAAQPFSSEQLGDEPVPDPADAGSEEAD